MVSRFRNSLGVGNIHQLISVHMTSWGFLLHLQSWTRTPWICVFLEFAKAIEVKKLHVHFEFLDFSDERSPAFHMHEMWFGLCIRTLGAPPPTNSRHNCYNFCMWSLQTPRLNVPLLVRGNAQHTTPIAKTHRTATLFASEPTEKLKMFINIHHRVNITIPSPKHHRSIATHHWDTKASPTQSRDITNTKPRHHPHITKTSQRNHYTSPRHARDITDTSFKDHQNITSTCRKHLDTSPKNHWNIS